VDKVRNIKNNRNYMSKDMTDIVNTIEKNNYIGMVIFNIYLYIIKSPPDINISEEFCHLQGWSIKYKSY
jgi:hypothetical protein